MKNLDLIADVHPLEVCSISTQTNRFIVKLEAHDAQGNAIGYCKAKIDLEAAYSAIIGDDYDKVGVPCYKQCIEDTEMLMDYVHGLIAETEDKGVFCDPNSEYESFRTTKVQRDRKSKR